MNQRNITRLSNGVSFFYCCSMFFRLAGCSSHLLALRCEVLCLLFVSAWVLFSSLRREVLFFVHLARLLFSSLMREVSFIFHLARLLFSSFMREVLFIFHLARLLFSSLMREVFCYGWSLIPLFGVS